MQGSLLIILKVQRDLGYSETPVKFLVLDSWCMSR